MAKLRPEDLDRIAERMKRVMALREGTGRVRITVHMGTCGIAAGARTIVTTLLHCLDESTVQDVIISTSGCGGLCSREPMMTVELAGEAPVQYVDLTADKVKRIFAEHVVGGKVVRDYALAVGSEQTV